MAAMCVECEDTVAAVCCEDCKDVYCPLCFKAQHHAGSRLNHRTTDVLGSSSSSSSIAVSPVPHREEPATPLVAHIPPPADARTIETPAEAVVAVSPPVVSLTHEEASEADDSEDELMAREIEAVPSALMKEVAYIPLRLSEDERALFNLLDAALNVSEYTDAVDVLSSCSPLKRMLRELNETFGVLSGLLIANNFRQGRRLVQEKQFKDNEDFFSRVFEIGRRYKVMNPERMRNNYGKMIYLLQDANVREIRKYLGFSCVAPIKTVATLLEERQALDMLRDTRCAVATSVAAATNADLLESPQNLQRFLRDKQQAIDELVRDRRRSW